MGPETASTNPSTMSFGPNGSGQVRSCQNCRIQFTIEPEDFDFYKKINVPPPTWCPECRFYRRLAVRNERIFFKRNCDMCQKSMISIYGREELGKIYCQSCWWSDKWDGVEFGKEFDFSKPFFSQYSDLLLDVPKIALNSHQTNLNSDYVNYVVRAKNAYLCFGGGDVENVYFSTLGVRIKDSAEIYFSSDSERCYEISYCTGSYNVAFAQNCRGCRDSYFIEDCANCHDCILSSGLRNKQYYFKNEQLTKEQYFEKKNEFLELLHKDSAGCWDEFRAIRQSIPKKYLNIIHSNNCIGDHITNSKDCSQSFNIFDIEKCKYSVDVLFGGRDIYDATSCGLGNEAIYEVMTSSMKVCQAMFSSVVRNDCLDVRYSSGLHSSSHLFGCIGLRNKQYCILNKQYTKEEYEELVPKIIEHMNTMPYIDKQGRVYKYGEFFPPELSPFAYNETIAQEYFPLTKEEALNQGYSWKDPDTKQYQITKTPQDLPDHIKDAPDSILQETIGCMHEGTCNEQCTTAFRIIPEELQFYRRMNLPLPRLCPNCRHYERLKQRNPLKLWHRQCMCELTTHQHQGKCTIEFETSYAPDRPEIVYCEACYNAEVA